MAKNTSSASPVAPGRLPDKDFFSRVRPVDSRISPPEVKTVSAKEVLATLKQFGKGWDSELEKMLKIPERLFMVEMDDARYYASDERFGLGDLIPSLGAEALRKPSADYGIALYSTAGTTYFLLADFNRRIIVREPIFSIHDSPQEKDWGRVKTKITDALTLAESTSGKRVAVYDLALGTSILQ